MAPTFLNFHKQPKDITTAKQLLNLDRGHVDVKLDFCFHPAGKFKVIMGNHEVLQHEIPLAAYKCLIFANRALSPASDNPYWLPKEIVITILKTLFPVPKLPIRQGLFVNNIFNHKLLAPTEDEDSKADIPAKTTNKNNYMGLKKGCLS